LRLWLDSPPIGGPAVKGVWPEGIQYTSGCRPPEPTALGSSLAPARRVITQRQIPLRPPALTRVAGQGSPMIASICELSVDITSFAPPSV